MRLFRSHSAPSTTSSFLLLVLALFVLFKQIHAGIPVIEPGEISAGEGAAGEGAAGEGAAGEGSEGGNSDPYGGGTTNPYEGGTTDPSESGSEAPIPGGSSPDNPDSSNPDNSSPIEEAGSAAGIPESTDIVDTESSPQTLFSEGTRLRQFIS